MSEIKVSKKGLKNVKTFCETEGVRVHTAGLKSGDVLTVDDAESIDCKVKDFNGNKYAEVSCTVNGTKQYKSLGSLFRSFLDDDDNQIKPNKFKNLGECLDSLCGKTVTLKQIEGAENFNFNTKERENITVFEVIFTEESEKTEKPKRANKKNN